MNAKIVTRIPKLKGVKNDKNNVDNVQKMCFDVNVLTSVNVAEQKWKDNSVKGVKSR